MDARYIDERFVELLRILERLVARYDKDDIPDAVALLKNINLVARDLTKMARTLGVLI